MVVTDSLYSTNARYSYFSIDEIAEKIWKLGNSEQCAQDYFYSLVNGGNDKEDLFSAQYGIRKNLSDGSRMMSLLSKYAYYSLLKDKDKYPLGFPIYDRLAKSSYPVIWKMLGKKNSMSENPSIEKYISKMNELRKELFGNDDLFDDFQQFDILDSYLWRMGKFEDGNLSLLLDRDDYKKFVNNLGLVSTDLADFDKQVIMKCDDNNNKPFKGLVNEKYLNQLLEHWRLYHSAK